MLIAFAGAAEARGHGDDRGDAPRDERPQGDGADAGASTDAAGIKLVVEEPEPGSACRPQC